MPRREPDLRIAPLGFDGVSGLRRDTALGSQQADRRKVDELLIGQSQRSVIAAITHNPWRQNLLLDVAERLAEDVLAAHETAVLSQAEQAPLEIATHERPELILLDIRMPGMDGYEVAAAIRCIPGLEQTSIVAVTASVIDAITTAGFDGYVSKPIDPETFIGEIERSCR